MYFITYMSWTYILLSYITYDITHINFNRIIYHIYEYILYMIFHPDRSFQKIYTYDIYVYDIPEYFRQNSEDYFYSPRGFWAQSVIYIFDIYWYIYMYIFVYIWCVGCIDTFILIFKVFISYFFIFTTVDDRQTSIIFFFLQRYTFKPEYQNNW